MKSSLLSAVVIAGLMINVLAADPVAVVELFTSEGCSSCPPADQLLSELAAKARDKKHPVYFLAFHVDYWDYLGWRDPFDDPRFSTRQREYAERAGTSRVYTPQMIVNGGAGFVGSSQPQAERAIAAALSKDAVVGATFLSRPGQGEIQIEYTITDAPTDAVLHLALVEDGVVSNIRRGENAGRKLRHDGLVRAFTSVNLRDEMTGLVTLPVPKGMNQEHSHIIGYVQRGTVGEIIGANQVSLPAAAE